MWATDHTQSPACVPRTKLVELVDKCVLRVTSHDLSVVHKNCKRTPNSMAGLKGAAACHSNIRHHPSSPVCVSFRFKTKTASSWERTGRGASPIEEQNFILENLDISKTHRKPH